MNKKTLISLLLFLPFSVYSQEIDSNIRKVYVMDEKGFPHPSIGEKEFEELLDHKVKELKKKHLIDCGAKRKKSIYVGFAINKDGFPEKIEILSGINLAVDREATEFIKNLNFKWTTGKITSGRTVTFNFCKGN